MYYNDDGDIQLYSKFVYLLHEFWYRLHKCHKISFDYEYCDYNNVFYSQSKNMKYPQCEL